MNVLEPSSQLKFQVPRQLSSSICNGSFWYQVHMCSDGPACSAMRAIGACAIVLEGQSFGNSRNHCYS